MTTTINADTVTGGAIVTGDASGQLALQGAGVTQLTVTNSGITFANPLTLPSGSTLTAAILNDGYTEEVYALGTSGSLALNPTNGSIQTCVLTGNPTFTDSLSAGQSISLTLTNGASYAVTWPTMTWIAAGGSAAPTLTAKDVIVFWKIGATLYGAYVGSGV